MKKFKFLLHLIELGIKPEHAVKATQHADNRTRYDSAAEAIDSFSWADTGEGYGYWEEIYIQHVTKTL